MEESISPENEVNDELSEHTTAQIISAITDARNLVAFTAKSGIEVPEAILTTLITAKTIWDEGKWTPEFAVQFWEAFRKMNQLIKPATVASVNMICMEPRHDGFKGFIQNQYGRSEASRTITRNTLWTLGILIIVLIFQIYWVIGNSLSLKLTELLNAEKEITTAINQAELERREIELRYKQSEEEARANLEVGSTELSELSDFRLTPDYERDTLEAITLHQKLEDELEALRAQLNRNSAILVLWSAGWNEIVDEDKEDEQEPPPIESGEAFVDLDNQILSAQERLNEDDVQEEIDAKVMELDSLVKGREILDNELETILADQTPTNNDGEVAAETEAGALQVSALFEQKAREREQIHSEILAMQVWLGRTDLVKTIMAERKSELDKLKADRATLLEKLTAEKEALERQIERDRTNDLSHRVRLSTDFMLIILQSYILPVLYGLLGASVYVLRTIAREISEVTYTGDRGHLLRLALGTLSGLIIGWFVFLLPGQSIVTSISPLALAFIVGYNTEILFALMDRVIAVFTKDPEEKQKPSATTEKDKTNGNQTESQSPVPAVTSD
jgi:hypothetical protein